MPLNSYQVLMQCLGFVRKMTRLAELTGISKSVLTLIAKGRGKYEGCLSTQLRLQAFLAQNENRRGRPFTQNTKGGDTHE